MQSDDECRRNNGNPVLGVCWRNCNVVNGVSDVDVGALCRETCKGETPNEVLGVCWGSCGNGVDVGALCRAQCPTGMSDVAGVCWGSCNSDQVDVGALCRDNCRSDFNDVAGVCWGKTGTYARQMRIPASIKTYDPGYQPPEIDNIPFAWCNFARPEMLDRMAQFYYDYSILHPTMIQTDDDGNRLMDPLIQYDYIIRFHGVIASSELSCDVVCIIRTVTYDPVTGGNYKQQDGAIYKNDVGNFFSYRRFYFTNTEGKDKKGEMLFTVTGCTNADNTAPDSFVKSTDPDVDLVPSLPKVFKIRDTGATQVSFTNMDFKAGAVAAVSGFLAVGAGAVGQSTKLGKKAGGPATLGLVGGMAGTVLGTNISTAKTGDSSKSTGNFIVAGAPDDKDKNGNQNIYVATNSDNYAINHGLIYEQSEGYEPNINFCAKFILPEITCPHPDILQDTVDSYHAANPNKHIKEIVLIEPRGRDASAIGMDNQPAGGCYYRWKETSYDPKTNIEGNYMTEKEIVLQYSQPDLATCVYKPIKNSFTDDLSKYPIRSYTDSNGTVQYPTRDSTPYANISARYVRIRPPTTSGDGVLSLSQVAIYDETNTIVSVNRPVYASSTAPSAATAGSVTDGTLIARNAPYWSSAGGGRTTELFDIDLGKNTLISTIVVYGPADNKTSTVPDRMTGVRVQLLYTNDTNATAVSEKVLATSATGQVVNFMTANLKAKYPSKPFIVPRPPVPEAPLGGGACTTKCQDKAQIDILVKQYNDDAKNTGKILKVLRGVTPASAPLRCDFEVEMFRTETGGKKTVSKETVAMSVAQAAGTCTFNYTASLGPGIFIQQNTPLLSAVDTSGGIFTFKGITKAVTDIFTGTIAPMLALDPMGKLKQTVLNSDTAANNMLKAATTLQGLQGCPNTKCSDPSVLAAIMQRYNVDNNSPADDFGVEINVMNRILRAGTSGPSSCDVLFENLYEMYDDILYDPASSETTTKVYRFPLTNIGNCQFQANAGTDVSGNGFGVSSDASTLPTPFTQAACTVNCRDPAILRSVKQRLETRYASPNSVPNFKSISQSFLNGANVCEYQMLKDVATKNTITQQFTTETDMSTYVSAVFNVNPTGCTFTLKEATEYFPDDITYVTDPVTKIQSPYINKVKVKIPTLYDYDETQPSRKVNGQTQILS